MRKVGTLSCKRICVEHKDEMWTVNSIKSNTSRKDIAGQSANSVDGNIKTHTKGELITKSSKSEFRNVILMWTGNGYGRGTQLQSHQKVRGDEMNSIPSFCRQIDFTQGDVIWFISPNHLPTSTDCDHNLGRLIT